jgi:hypothetical protein
MNTSHEDSPAMGPNAPTTPGAMPPLGAMPPGAVPPGAVPPGAVPPGVVPPAAWTPAGASPAWDPRLVLRRKNPAIAGLL